jgi:hypothetical protein
MNLKQKFFWKEIGIVNYNINVLSPGLPTRLSHTTIIKPYLIYLKNDLY